MAKFDTEDNCFVHVATHGGAIMMVTAIRSDGLVPRYDLEAIDHTTYGNIGEYELTPATDDEVKAALEQHRAVCDGA